ncbi:Putative phosphotransferase enzyme family protein [Tolypocladium paradoxum]|uniref:non-specific serine/threonine protein kinase n=1 Tax=Tolypocladium paradoxum TaxID=94208 RepID=A0A2S4KRF8_9HYPO|nr:Putative phosphotransferase enzyme family protein [Tolypocladium paradoxum]
MYWHQITTQLGTEYPIVFTHGDIAARNIMVRDGRIVALLDWEFAGWYPEYWEYVFALRGMDNIDWETLGRYIPSLFAKRPVNQLPVVQQTDANRFSGIYISTLATMTVEGYFMVTIQDRPVPRHTVRMSKEDGGVFEVDFQTAWNEMGLDAGRSNEVEVKVHFSARENRSIPSIASVDGYNDGNV